jgi:Tfp pilus assembly protein PilF
LIQLGQLYMETDRCRDAVHRFEQALDNGVRYADVYYVLGNLYRREGNIEGARQSYRQALNINKRYEAARQALDSLAA